MASVNRGGSASVEDSRTAALPSTSCQCGLSISCISFDLSDILNSVVILRDFFREISCHYYWTLETDCQVVLLPPVSPNWQLGIRPVVSESQHGKTSTFHEHLIHSLQCIYTSRYKCSFCRLCTLHLHMKGFIMSHFDQYGPDDLMQFEVNLDIPAFVRDAVRSKMKRDTILVYLHMVSQTYQATDKMRRFATVAQRRGFNSKRNFDMAAPLLWRFDGTEAYQPEAAYPTSLCRKSPHRSRRERHYQRWGKHSEMRQHFEITDDFQIFKPAFAYQATTMQVPGKITITRRNYE